MRSNARIKLSWVKLDKLKEKRGNLQCGKNNYWLRFTDTEKYSTMKITVSLFMPRTVLIFIIHNRNKSY